MHTSHSSTCAPLLSVKSIRFGSWTGRSSASRAPPSLTLRITQLIGEYRSP